MCSCPKFRLTFIIYRQTIFTNSGLFLLSRPVIFTHENGLPSTNLAIEIDCKKSREIDFLKSYLFWLVRAIFHIVCPLLKTTVIEIEVYCRRFSSFCVKHLVKIIFH